MSYIKNNAPDTIKDRTFYGNAYTNNVNSNLHRKNKHPLELLDKFVVNGKVPIHVAQKLIQESAYWYDHPSGYPVSAPKHFERVQAGASGWEIEFGANTFHVGMAIELCVKRIRNEINKSKGKYFDCAALNVSLEHILTSCVSNYVGDFYDYYWSDEKGYMKFGTQAINTHSFINFISDYINIHRYCK